MLGIRQYLIINPKILEPPLSSSKPMSWFRLPYAGAVEGMMPTLFGLVSKRSKTPVTSLAFLVSFIVSIEFKLMNGMSYLIQLKHITISMINAYMKQSESWKHPKDTKTVNIHKASFSKDIEISCYHQNIFAFLFHIR